MGDNTELNNTLQVGSPTLITKYLQMDRNCNQKSLKHLDNLHESLQVGRPMLIKKYL